MNNKNYQIKILLKLIVLPTPAIDSAISLPEEAVDILVPLIKERFPSFKNEVLQSTSWLNPQYCDKDHNTNSVR